MSLTQQLAKHLRDVHLGGNWTTSCFKDILADVTWQQATTQVHGFNTIATLVYHTHYYIPVVTRVLQGAALIATDKQSFETPLILSQQDWDVLLTKVFADAQTLATLIESLPESILFQDFTDPKYGTYYRNIQGITEHLHYHLGQISLIKKILTQNN